MRYFFDNDGDGHNYMIPLNLRSKWLALIVESYDNRISEEKREEIHAEIENEFGQYRTGGGISSTSFTDPQNIK